MALRTERKYNEFERLGGEVPSPRKPLPPFGFEPPGREDLE